jgi:hypothetical protein
MCGVLRGLHMRTVEQNVELSIADTDVDEKGQLIDIESTLGLFVPSVQALDTQLVSYLQDDQSS